MSMDEKLYPKELEDDGPLVNVIASVVFSSRCMLNSKFKVECNPDIHMHSVNREGQEDLPVQI